VIGIGYQGLTLGALIAQLTAEGVDVLIDIRLNAISRKAGYSKRALSAALAEAGIEYVHDPRLGNPKHNRAGYAELASPAGQAARDQFRSMLATDASATALRELADRLDEHTVALLCFEADERHCHRQQVIESVRELRDSLAVV
jgi:uncharacterized protein (DUF488 family)